MSSAYLLIKERVAKEKRLERRVRSVEEVLIKSKKRTCPLLDLFFGSLSVQGKALPLRAATGWCLLLDLVYYRVLL